MILKEAVMNINKQFYKGIELKLIKRNYSGYKSKRFAINETNQNVWIPIKHLMDDGTIKENENIDYVFRKAQTQLELAGYLNPIVGIKRLSHVNQLKHDFY